MTNEPAEQIEAEVRSLFVSLSLAPWDSVEVGLGVAGLAVNPKVAPDFGLGFLRVFETLEDLQKYCGDDAPYLRILVGKEKAE